MGQLEERAKRAAAIVGDAGGKLIGRTRLQKIAYLLKLSGADDGYVFNYKYYGPYSEDLSDDIRSAWALGILDEDIKEATWGGSYSIFKSKKEIHSNNKERKDFAKMAAAMDAILLELAATAAFLKGEGYRDPWAETRERKPDKATDERIESAKREYRKLRSTKLGERLPDLD